MDWIAGHLRQLTALLPDPSTSADADRVRFRAAIHGLVEALASKEGVRASFAFHEGLLVDRAGEAQDFEALAAVGQGCAAMARDAAGTLRMGEPRQLVIVGAADKLAFFILGSLAVGVLCPQTVHLGSVLYRETPRVYGTSSESRSSLGADSMASHPS